MRLYRSWIAALQNRLRYLHSTKLDRNRSRHAQRKVHFEPLENRLAPAFDITNLGLASGVGVGVDGHLATFTVSEPAQGVDLNGDSDTSDRVVHLYDLLSGVTTNLGLAALSPFGVIGEVRIDGNLVAFSVGEAAQGGIDLNGDSDASDFVVHVYDASTGVVTNLGLAGVLRGISQNVVAFEVSESDQGANLNGDTDTADNVLHVYNAATGVATNLGLATVESTLFGKRHVQVGERLVGFSVSEEDQGGADLNGDHDATGEVLFVYNIATGVTKNFHLTAADFQVSGNLLGFTLSEAGSTDLNGDGDSFDLVFHAYNASTDITTNLGLAGLELQASGHLLAFSVDEFLQGAADLNGDGDTIDHVMFLYDATTAVTTNLGLDCNRFVFRESLLAMEVPEEGQGNVDLNGDGDAVDSVAHLYDADRNITTNLGLAGGIGLPRFDGDLVVILVSELFQGNRDLNGDLDTSDSVLFAFDRSTGITTNLRKAHSRGLVSVSGDLVAFTVSESDQASKFGPADLNGDGDTTDDVLHVYDAGTATTTNLRVTAELGLFSGDLLLFVVSESFQGGTDLNGDGDADDGVVHVARKVTGEQNDPPVNTVPSAQATAENVSLIFSSADGNEISVSDPDVGNNAVEVTLSVSNGALSLSTIAGLAFTTGDGTADSSMTFTGSLVDINAALEGLSFAPTVDFLGQATLTIISSDLGNSGFGGPLTDTDSVSIDVTPAPNAPPVNSVPGAQVTGEDVALVFSAANGNAISVSDPDAGSSVVQVTLSATNGTLTLSATTGLDFSSACGTAGGAGDGTGDASMTFCGTIAAIAAALEGLTFTPTHDFDGSALLTILANDLGHTGTGGPHSDSDSVLITVQTAQQQATDLGQAINDLAATGELSSGQANALKSKLNAIVAKIEQGKINPAINQLHAFINQVNSYVADGTLTADEGAPLIDAANDLLASIAT